MDSKPTPSNVTFACHAGDAIDAVWALARLSTPIPQPWAEALQPMLTNRWGQSGLPIPCVGLPPAALIPHNFVTHSDLMCHVPKLCIVQLVTTAYIYTSLCDKMARSAVALLTPHAPTHPPTHPAGCTSCSPPMQPSCCGQLQSQAPPPPPHHSPCHLPCWRGS
jgi:hypothetical protein